MEGKKLSDRFLDQSRAQAAGADADTLVALADDGSHRLNVRVEYTPSLIVGVADIVTGYRLL